MALVDYRKLSCDAHLEFTHWYARELVKELLDIVHESCSSVDDVKKLLEDARYKEDAAYRVYMESVKKQCLNYDTRD